MPIPCDCKLEAVTPRQQGDYAVIKKARVVFKLSVRRPSHRMILSRQNIVTPQSAHVAVHGCRLQVWSPYPIQRSKLPPTFAFRGNAQNGCRRWYCCDKSVALDKLHFSGSAGAATLSPHLPMSVFALCNTGSCCHSSLMYQCPSLLFATLALVVIQGEGASCQECETLVVRSSAHSDALQLLPTLSQVWIRLSAPKGHEGKVD